jgi:hypothetical protein
MRRLATLCSVATLLLLGGAVGGSPVGHAFAPAPESASTEGHPLVGAWILTVAEDPDGFPSLVAFSSDGIYQEFDHDGTAGYGAWEATGPTSAALTFVTLSPAPEGEFGGSATIRATVEVSADGQSFTAPFTIEFTGVEGIPEGEFGPGTATGTRIAIEPMGTPVGTLEDLFGGVEGTEPAATEPGTEPLGTEPAASEPVGTEPLGTEPAASTPGTEPAGTEPAGTEPAGTEPAGTEPVDTAPPGASTPP